MLQETPIMDEHLQQCPTTAKTAQSRLWDANLTLEFDGSRQSEHQAIAQAKTVMATMKFHGPLRVQRPFYPETSVCVQNASDAQPTLFANPCHIYLLHPPGGLVSGDHLSTLVTAKNKAHCVLTTPSAAKVYQADFEKNPQIIKTKLDIGDSALEWLPQENIIFNQAQADIMTEVNLSSESRFMGWEVLCLGRPANQLPFLEGRVKQSWQIFLNNQLIFRDVQRINLDHTDNVKNQKLLTEKYGYHDLPVSGTMIVYSPEIDPTELLSKAREYWTPEIQTAEKEFRVLTLHQNLLVGRYLGGCTEKAQQSFRGLWQHLRPFIMKREAVPPRIWAT